jgi:Na+/H+ antiporter NhaD/arsenite permease-like protein
LDYIAVAAVAVFVVTLFLMIKRPRGLRLAMRLETMRRKGVNISLKEYLKVGAVLSIAQVAIASAVLWAELSMGFHLML